MFTRILSGIKVFAFLLTVFFLSGTVILSVMGLFMEKSPITQIEESVSIIYVVSSTVVTVSLPMWAFFVITIGVFLVGASMGSSQARIGRF